MDNDTFFPTQQSGQAGVKRAQGLLRIAMLESKRPLAGCRVLICADDIEASPLLEQLYGLTREARAVKLEDIDGLGAAEAFDIAILFYPVMHETLKRLMAPESLVIDASPKKSGGWAVYDGELPYERVRVISLFES